MYNVHVTAIISAAAQIQETIEFLQAENAELRERLECDRNESKEFIANMEADIKRHQAELTRPEVRSRPFAGRGDPAGCGSGSREENTDRHESLRCKCDSHKP